MKRTDSATLAEKLAKVMDANKELSAANAKEQRTVVGKVYKIFCERANGSK